MSRFILTALVGLWVLGSAQGAWGQFSGRPGSTGSLKIGLSGGGVYLEHSREGTYRLGPQAKALLIKGLKTALEWEALNRQHRKTFEKEIVRFQVVEKSLYTSFGYHEVHANTMVLEFMGEGENGSSCLLTFADRGLGGQIIIYWLMESRDGMQAFLDALEGRSTQPEIDAIFKRN
jgi:hypothetical protein